MPELPEVETIVRQLNKSLAGQVVKSFDCNWIKIIKPLSLVKFKKNVVGAKVVAVKRRAKVILIDLKNGHLAIHLKMTGQLVYIPLEAKYPIAGTVKRNGIETSKSKLSNRLLTGRDKVVVGGHRTPLEETRNDASDEKKNAIVDHSYKIKSDLLTGRVPNKFTHATFTFKNGARLYFNDVRKFGWIKWLGTAEHLELHEAYGPDGLSGHAKILEVLLKNKKRFPKKSIKGYLLDQTVISGLGNIYADEVCFMAGILPSRQVKNASSADWKNISKLIPKILKKSIRLGGTTFSTYRDANGQQGSYWKSRLVYGRAGEKCKKCGSIIKKTIVASRGTSYCPTCQK